MGTPHPRWHPGAVHALPRATFYKHFDDMRDFTRCYLTALTDRFMAALSQDNDLEDLFVYAERIGGLHAHDAPKAALRQPAAD